MHPVCSDALSHFRVPKYLPDKTASGDDAVFRFGMFSGCSNYNHVGCCRCAAAAVGTDILIRSGQKFEYYLQQARKRAKTADKDIKGETNKADLDDYEKRLQGLDLEFEELLLRANFRPEYN